MKRLAVRKKPVIQLLRTILTIASVVVGMLLLYLFMAIILSIVPSNRNFSETPQDAISIYLLSNGVHLDVVVPLTNPYKDWRQDLKIPSSLEEQVHLVAFGWGDREFYLNTPEWSDLSLSTALNALFWKDSSAVHIRYYRFLTESKTCIEVQISINQYMKLVDFFENTFLRNEYNQTILIENAGYNQFDQFYEGKRSYHFFYTCNTWTNQALKKSGLRSCQWTPFDKGILWQYRGFLNDHSSVN